MPLHLMVAIGLLTLIWGYVLFRRSGLVDGCLVTIGAGSCFGHPFFHVSALTLDRLLLVGVSVWYFGYRNVTGLRPKALNKVDAALGG